MNFHSNFNATFNFISSEQQPVRNNSGGEQFRIPQQFVGAGSSAGNLMPTAGQAGPSGRTQNNSRYPNSTHFARPIFIYFSLLIHFKFLRFWWPNCQEHLDNMSILKNIMYHQSQVLGEKLNIYSRMTSSSYQIFILY